MHIYMARAEEITWHARISPHYKFVFKKPFFLKKNLLLFTLLDLVIHIDINI